MVSECFLLNNASQHDEHRLYQSEETGAIILSNFRDESHQIGRQFFSTTISLSYETRLRFVVLLGSKRQNPN